MKARRPAVLLAILWTSLGAYFGEASAQDMLKVIKAVEPGIGYSQFKQWVIENKLLFESFTRDSMVARDASMGFEPFIRIQIRFCGGDDYGGRASNITIQQNFFEPKAEDMLDVLKVQRDYVEFLTGKANSEGKFEGNFSVRRDRKDGSDGLAMSQDTEKGSWEVGLFKRGKSALLNTVRRKDSICQ